MITNVLLAALLALNLVLLALAALALRRLGRIGGEEGERRLREEFRVAREESLNQARSLREEIANTQDKANETLVRTVGALGENQKSLLDGLTRTTRESAEALRAEIEKALARVAESLALTQQEQRGLMRDAIDALGKLTEANRLDQEKARQSLDQQFQQIQERLRVQMREVVDALGKSTDANRLDQEKSRQNLDLKFKQIQESNEKKLDEMRQTVDEKLQGVLEKRLGESFKLVSERLEAVQRGLGEMKNLADGVGDLKRVLTNVKDRGTWGEYQLEAILQATLTPDQYARNVRPTGSGEVVEFAVKLPGSEQDLEKPVWLPMDSKFPKEDYERLLLAVEKADSEGVKSATTALIRSLKNSAKDIHDKYISPPHTTDFAILFLPTEGLYAEVLRQPGLLEDLQKNWQILVAGPTILAALLNSLRVGFRTLAIEKRSHEVWRLLGKVKSEFGKFGDVLTKVKKQLDAASNSIDQTQTRTRAIQRNLQNVEDIPLDSTADLFLPGVGETIEADGEGKSAIEED